MSIIGINGRCIEGQPTGVGRYLANLLRCWGENPDQRHHFVIYTKSGTTVIDDFLRTHSCFEIKKIHSFKLPILKKEVGWEQFFLAAELAQNIPDVFFSPSYKIPWYIRPKCVLTIHDMSYEAHPEWFYPSSRWVLRIFSRRGAKKAAMILTDSAFSRQEILKFYHVDENKIQAIPLGVDDHFFQLPDLREIQRVKEKYAEGQNYFFYVGTMGARRRVQELIKAFTLVSSKLPACRLVLVGANMTYPFYPLELPAGTKHFDYIPEDDLVPLYQGAIAFFYPSVYEGFGLPVLEAMACGTPVVTVSAASLPEVAGDAVLFVNPYDVQEISATMLRLGTDEGLRRKLREKGLVRAKEFSWERCARDTMTALETVAAGKLP